MTPAVSQAELVAARDFLRSARERREADPRPLTDPQARGPLSGRLARVARGRDRGRDETRDGRDRPASGSA